MTPRPGRARRTMCMLAHSYYEEDPRVRRQAEALVAAGWEVDVFSLRRPGDPRHGTLNGVRIERLPVQRHQGAGIATYVAEYLHFLTLAGLAATAAHLRRRYRVAQVHTLPDFLVFAALPLRVAGGVPVVIDLHELMPDFFRSRFPRAASATAYRLLRLQERWSIAIATAALTVNELLADRLRARGVRDEKLTVILNSPDLRLFDPAAHPIRPFAHDGELRIVYAGALTPMYEVDVAIRAIPLIAAAHPTLRVRLDVYGRGDAEDALRTLAADVGVADSVRFHGRIPLEAVSAAIAAADVGLAPTRWDEFTDLSLSTKLFEYAALGKPVVATRLAAVERYFPDGSIATYRSGDAAGLERAVTSLVQDDVRRADHVERARKRARELSWDREAERYVSLVSALADQHAPRDARVAVPEHGAMTLPGADQIA